MNIFAIILLLTVQNSVTSRVNVDSAIIKGLDTLSKSDHSEGSNDLNAPKQRNYYDENHHHPVTSASDSYEPDQRYYHSKNDYKPMPIDSDPHMPMQRNFDYSNLIVKKSITPPVNLEAAPELWRNKQNSSELSERILEGDIVISEDHPKDHYYNGLLSKDKRWPNAEIPYVFDDTSYDEAQRQWIEFALMEYYLKTCVKPRHRRDTDRDFIFITGKKDGCFSFVGKRGGNQTINLKAAPPGEGCLARGTIIHEFLHALGFFHQQMASNRDEHIEIAQANLPGGNANFEKKEPNVTGSFGEIYDYESIMHYNAYSFSKNGERTIITKNPYIEIGQRDGLSDLDIKKLNKMYECHSDPPYFYWLYDKRNPSIKSMPNYNKN